MALVRSLGRRVVLFAAATVLAVAVACASGDPDGSFETQPSDPAGIAIVEAVRIVDMDGTRASGDLPRAAVEYARDHDIELGLTALDDFDVRQVREGRGKLQHVRLRQFHAGLPVWGAGIVVHAADHRFLGLSGTLARNLGELPPTTTALAAEDALAIGKADYASRSVSAAPDLAYARESTELVVYPRAGQSARIAWHVVFYTELQADLDPALSNYFVDADTGDILDHFNAIHTLEQASGPGGNPKVARSWVEKLDVEPEAGEFAMSTARLVTTNMNNLTSGRGTTVTGPLDPIGDAPINDAHGFAEATLNMMQEWYGHDSIDDNGFLILSRVHYSRNYENAFWDGTRMTYGDGANLFYPLSGDVDVVGHEINHGFTSFHSDLIYSGRSGGNNESFSDIAGTIVEFFDEGDTADFDIGRDVFRAEDDALRFMCDPTADGRSIDNAADYRPGMNVHFSSGVMNKAFCLSARRLGSEDRSPEGPATQASVRRAGEAWYEANASFWTESSDFDQACDGVLAAAAALGFTDEERELIRQSWAEVGVYCDGSLPPVQCDETLTTESGTIASPNFPSNYPDNFDHTWCIQPASGARATLTFDAFDTEAGFDFVRIRDGNNATLSHTSGSTPPPPASAPVLVVTFTTDALVNATGWSASWSTDVPPSEPARREIASPAGGDDVSGDGPVSASAAHLDGLAARSRFAPPDRTTADDLTASGEMIQVPGTAADRSGPLSLLTLHARGAGSSAASGPGGAITAVPCVNGNFAAADVPRAIPDNDMRGFRSTIAVGDNAVISSLALSLDISHAFRGDLIVTMRSPSGIVYDVTRRQGGSADNLVIQGMDLPNFDGERSAGIWQLQVRDLHGGEVGTLNSWSMDIVGDCGSDTTNQPPTVTLTSPAAGSDVSGNVLVSATASDPDGSVVLVSFALPDGTTVDDVDPPYEVTWNSSAMADGVYQISVQSFDDSGAGSDVESVAVDADNGQCFNGTSSAADVPRTIPDNNTKGVRSFIAVAGDAVIRSLTLSLDISHTFRGDLIVALTSPSGTVYNVSKRQGGSADNIVIREIDLPNFNGERAAGTWQLQVRDLHAGEVGMLNSWSIDILRACGDWSGSSTPNLPLEGSTACTILTVSDDGDAGDVLLTIAGEHDRPLDVWGELFHNGEKRRAFPLDTFPLDTTLPLPQPFSVVDLPVMDLTDNPTDPTDPPEVPPKVPFSGNAAGDWTLCLTDTNDFGETGTLFSWSVHN